MFFDGLIIVLALLLSLSGWRRGLLRSWPGLLSMLAATALSRYFYMDFSAWIVSQLRISPEAAVIAGYLLLWLSTEILLEIILSLFRADASDRPLFMDKLGGAMYGLTKLIAMVVLPLIASSVNLNIPPPPADKSGLKLPSITAGPSWLLPAFTGLSRQLLPTLGPWIASPGQESQD